MTDQDWMDHKLWKNKTIFASIEKYNKNDCKRTS